MAIALSNTAASGTYIVPNGQAAQNATTAGTSTTFSFPSKPDVFSYTVGTSTALQPSLHVTNPGVFTQGTAPEGTISRTTNDSNS